MYTCAVFNAKRANEWRSLVLQLVERRLYCDVQLQCGLRPLKHSNAGVRARLCRCVRGGIMERERTNVCPCDVLDAEQRIE